MSGLMHLVMDNYTTNFMNIHKDNDVNSWMLMGSPMPMITIIVSYLYFVLKFGPQMMSVRKPYDLQYVLVAYNFFQVIFSIWLCTMPVRAGAVQYLITHSCQPKEGPQNPFSHEVTRGAWWWWFSKMIELLDTVFFVLRKKQHQVTFLHVYHHTSTAFFSWFYLKYLPGEQGVIIGCLNSFVHVFMYTYYMIAAMGPRYQKYLWWKKYMTWIQLTQFCIMLVYLSTLLIFDCKFPKALTCFFVLNVTVFIALFSNFYRKAYKKKSS